jgi:hypothetical protein
MTNGVGSFKLRRSIYLAFAVVVILIVGLVAWSRTRHSKLLAPPVQSPVKETPSLSGDDHSATMMFAHNLELRKGPDFRVYVRWVRGHMLRTAPGTIPSFDDPDSFLLNLDKGVVDVKIADLSQYLGTVSPAGAPLQKLSIVPDGDHLKLKGTLHKVVPVPVEVQGTLSPGANGLVLFRVSKITALKMPVKGLLGALHLTIADLMPSAGIAGITVAGNDIVFDTQRLLPPPHIRGAISSISTDATTIKLIYGGAHDNEDRLAKWHNFMQLMGGTLSFGKVTMHDADLTLIDASDDPWFYLDLVKYQAQLTKSYTLMTEQAGLEVFMPDLDEKIPGKLKEPVTMEMLRNREKPIPTLVPGK